MERLSTAGDRIKHRNGIYGTVDVESRSMSSNSLLCDVIVPSFHLIVSPISDVSSRIERGVCSTDYTR